MTQSGHRYCTTKCPLMTQCASERIAASKLEENQIGWRLSRKADSTRLIRSSTRPKPPLPAKKRTYLLPFPIPFSGKTETSFSLTPADAGIKKPPLPRYSLAVDDPANVWAIGLLFVVGLIVSGVAFTSHRRATEAALLRRQVTVLQGYSRDLVDRNLEKRCKSLGSN